MKEGWNEVIIQLDANHRIKGGDRAWQLERLRVVKGKENWRAFKWFTSLPRTVQEAAHAEIRTDPAEGLSEALEAVHRVVQKYERAIDDAIAEMGERYEAKTRAVS